MTPKYKLTYFDFTGLGEPIRFLFHYGGIDFIDNRISLQDWPALKSTTPLEQVPLLEVDGKVLHQSLAVARYIAKQVGLAGSNDLENYEIDSAAETVNDVRLSIAQFRNEQDPERKKTIKELLDSHRLPLLFSRLDAWAKQNHGYLANGKLSWADFYFVSVLGYLDYFMGRDLLKEYPSLLTVKQNVLSIPSIKAWVEKRPEDHFE